MSTKIHLGSRCIFLRLVILILVLLHGSAYSLAESGLRFAPPPEPVVKPIIVHPRDCDKDMSRVSDRLEERLRTIRSRLAEARKPGKRAAIESELDQPVKVELVFSRRITEKQIDDFLRFGQIEYVYQAVSYGWVGWVPLRFVEEVARRMGESLVAIVDDQPVVCHMDEATRTARIRPVWASGFAGAPLGYTGSAGTTIGIIDTGCDDSHTDLSGRMRYWKDWTADRERNAVDYIGHGTHVTAIAVGTGSAAGAMTTLLQYTDSGDMSGLPSGYFYPSPIHIPSGISVAYSSTATWLGGGTTDLYLLRRFDGNTGSYNAVGSPSNGASPISNTWNFVSVSGNHYTAGLMQNASGTITKYAIANTVTYAPVGDGFNTFQGVAPGCYWACCKVFTNTGTATTTDIGEAIDDLVSKRSTYNIKIVNLSLGVNGDPGIDTTLRAKVNSMVNNGIVAVCSAGNDGPGTNPTNLIDDPGRASLAITVAASNDINQLTRYSSTGFQSPGSDEDYKPDVMAPGGSAYYSLIISADSNDCDARSMTFADQRSNDYVNVAGTSAAAPIVSGAAALVIQALENHGLVWNFSSSSNPLLVKMLLCATCTESNAPREVGSGNDPLLGRAGSPKDLCEGYGLINVDAAVEAASLTYDWAAWSETTGGGYYDRRAWARKINLVAGTPVDLFLNVPEGGDFDIYIYGATPDSKGNPVIRAYSTSVGDGVDEHLQFTPSISETGYLVVKRVSGAGTWTLMGPDSTPPASPVVADDGAYTLSTSSIHAMWAASDPESGIAEYQYAISSTTQESGIIPGGGWVSVGSSTEATRSGLALSYGQVYYVLVKAKNGAGLWSAVGTSDGIMVVQNYAPTIGAAKLLPDNTTVGLSGKVVTAVFADCFYMQEQMRSSGIRVAWLEPPAGLGFGKEVEVGGRIETVGGERQITAMECKIGAVLQPRSMLMVNRGIGGANWHYDAVTGAGQRGTAGSNDLNNIGLLITTTGRVTHVSGSDFWIDDGAGLTDAFGHIGIKISAPGLAIPVRGQYVKVTGISSCYEYMSALYPLIRATEVTVIP